MSYVWSLKVLDGGYALPPTDRVPFHTHTKHSATGASLSLGHVFGTVFGPTCATRTLHTTVSSVNSKRFCFNVASGAQCDLCQLRYIDTLTCLLTYLLTSTHSSSTSSIRCVCLLKQEKELIRQRCESDKRELVAAQDHARQQSIKIQSLQREKIELTSRMEQDTLSARLETTDSMIQLMKDKGELELQCRQLKTNLAGTDRSEIHVTAYPRSRVGIVGVLGGDPPVHVYRCSFVRENRL